MNQNVNGLLLRLSESCQPQSSGRTLEDEVFCSRPEALMSRSNIERDASANWYGTRLCAAPPMSDMYFGIACPRNPFAASVLKLAGEVFDIGGLPKFFD